MTMGIVSCDYQVITATSLCLTVYCLMCPLPHADQSIDGNIECRVLVHLSPNTLQKATLDRQHKGQWDDQLKTLLADST